MYMMCLYDAALTFDDRAWGRIGLFSTPLREGELSMRGTKCGVFVDLIWFFFFSFFFFRSPSRIRVGSHQSSVILHQLKHDRSCSIRWSIGSKRRAKGKIINGMPMMMKR